MFQNLKTGSLVYILDTKGTPRYYSLSVKNISDPFFPQPTAGKSFPFSQQYVTLTLEDNATWSVPLNATVANKDGLVVATSPDALVPTITANQQAAINAINSYEMHKNNLATYESILKEVDINYAKTKAQEEQIQTMRNEILELKKALSGIPTLKDIQGLLKSEANTKTSK